MYCGSLKRHTSKCLLGKQNMSLWYLGMWPIGKTAAKMYIGNNMIDRRVYRTNTEEQCLSLSSLWPLWCQNCCLKSVTTVEYQRGWIEPVECNTVICCLLIQRKCMGAITLWQQFYFSLLEIQNCLVYCNGFHLFFWGRFFVLNVPY